MWLSGSRFFYSLNAARRFYYFVPNKTAGLTVDSFFTLAPESPLGVYALEVGLETPGGHSQKEVRSFVVSDEFYLSGQ